MAKRSASWKRTFAADPQLREKLRAIGKAVGARPDIIEARRQWCKQRGFAAIGLASRTAETYARMGRTNTEKRLAWCPPELRADYINLFTSKGYTAAEAREIVLAQHERDMARFRARIGG